MRSISTALLFAATALIAIFTVTTVFAADTCTIGSLTPSCTGGTITHDSVSGSCRTIVCSNGADSMKTLACDKGSGYFELYKQAQTGSSVSKVCVGSACVGSSGFARSDLTCSVNNTTSTTTSTTSTSSNSSGTTGTSTGTTSTSSGTPTSGSSITDVSQLVLSCTASGCSRTRDVWDSTCRYNTFSTSAGNIQTTACEKSTGIEIYRNSYPSNFNFKVCYSGACVDQMSGFAKLSTSSASTSTSNSSSTNTSSTTANTTTTSTPTTSTTTSTTPTSTNTAMDDTVYYNGMALKGDKLHTGITSTIFWIGQAPSADTGWSNNYDSAWDVWWQEHYGGYDDPNSRNGYYPTGFTPKENPFYVAVPYTDFGDAGRKYDAFSVVPWSKEKSSWGYQESMIKNRWVKITAHGKVTYAQVENAGPGPTDDWAYVFGTNSQPTTDFGWKASIDVSPAVRDSLALGAVDTVDWQFVDASQVPNGPWKSIVTSRQSCWASTICP